MRDCFVRCKNFQQVNAVWTYIEANGDLRGWPKSLTRNLVDALDKHSQVYILIDQDGIVSGHLHEPLGVTEVVCTFNNVLTVTHIEELPGYTTFNGKKYYTTDLEAALAKCEVK